MTSCNGAGKGCGGANRRGDINGIEPIEEAAVEGLDESLMVVFSNKSNSFASRFVSFLSVERNGEEKKVSVYFF